MLYKIENKYYVKVSNYFVEVELIFKDNDVDLKPTKNKLEINKYIKYTEINFLDEKQNLLKNRNKKQVVEEVTEEVIKEQPKQEFKSFRKKSFK